VIEWFEAAYIMENMVPMNGPSIRDLAKDADIAEGRGRRNGEETEGGTR
jgi:hypothetical protein